MESKQSQVNKALYFRMTGGAEYSHPSRESGSWTITANLKSTGSKIQGDPFELSWRISWQDLQICPFVLKTYFHSPPSMASPCKAYFLAASSLVTPCDRPKGRWHDATAGSPFFVSLSSTLHSILPGSTSARWSQTDQRHPTGDSESETGSWL